MPWQPGSFEKIGPQEYSWMLLVHRAVVTGMQFGRQIVMPEGPLAFLGTDIYEPHTFPILILARTIIALVAFWSLWELGRALVRTWPAALIWLLAVALMLGVSPDCFFADCAFLLLLNYFLAHRRKVAASGIAMIIVLGAASLIKTNQLMYSVIAVTALTVDQVAQRRRRFYLPAFIYLGSVALFYVAARQSPRNAGSFLWGWWLVLIGHASAAAIPGPIIDALMYLLVAAAAVALIGWSQWKSLRWASVCLAAAMAAILLLLYKHSFVRQDKWHVMIAPTCALTLLLLYVPAIWRPAPIHLRVAGLLVAAYSVVFLFWILWSYDYFTP
ncbi:MAG TPA: hypothetical protein VHY37_13285, partial [Tepidisphaeraceae bacterium]|nr:hypothetical protein [Tepidisphaeraceae bacterium]